MKNRFLTILISISCFNIGYAQTSSNDYLKQKQLKANLNVLGLGANWEQKISKSRTINFEVGVKSDLTYHDNGNWSNSVYPTVGIELRQYYNVQKRLDRNKSTANNSASFFSITTEYLFKPIIKSNSSANNGFVKIIPAWGMQRKIASRVSFEGRFGWEIKYGTDWKRDLLFDNTKKWNSSPNIRLGIGYIIK